LNRWQQTLALLRGDPAELPALRIVGTRVHRSAGADELAEEQAEARAIRAAAKARKQAATTTCPADAGQATPTTPRTNTVTAEQRFLTAAADLLQQALNQLQADAPEAASEVARAIGGGASARVSATLNRSTGTVWLSTALVLPDGEAVQVSHAELQREVRQ
jgi:hypothetical protein